MSSSRTARTAMRSWGSSASPRTSTSSSAATSRSRLTRSCGTGRGCGGSPWCPAGEGDRGRTPGHSRHDPPRRDRATDGHVELRPRPPLLRGLAADEPLGVGVALREARDRVQQRPAPRGPVRDDPPDGVARPPRETGVPPRVDRRARGRRAWRDQGGVPPGGDSLARAGERIARCLDGIARLHHGQAAAVVGHGTVFTQFTARLKGERPTEAYKNSVPNAGFAVVAHGDTWRLVWDFASLPWSPGRLPPEE